MRTREKRVAITDKERAKNEGREREREGIRRVYYEMDGRMNVESPTKEFHFFIQPSL